MSLHSKRRPPMSHHKSTRQNASSNHGKNSEVTHIVHVTVLGLTGLTLNTKCKGNEDANKENRDPAINSNNMNGNIKNDSDSGRKIKSPKKPKMKTKVVNPKVINREEDASNITRALINKVPNPDQLQAFVSLSRGSTIVGTSNLSDPFHRVHEHDVVGTNSSEVSDEFEVPNMLDVERYAAIWPSTNNSDVKVVTYNDTNLSSALTDDANFGNATSTNKIEEEAATTFNNKKDLPSNVISFETKLCRSVTKERKNNTYKTTHSGGSLYEYAPKSFEVIVGAGMTNGNDGVVSSKQHNVEPLFGIPFGVATLAINTQQQELELPVLSLSQARPMISVGEVSMSCTKRLREDYSSIPLNIGTKGSNCQSKEKIDDIQPEKEDKTQKDATKQRRKRWGIFGGIRRFPSKEKGKSVETIESKNDIKDNRRYDYLTAEEISMFNNKYSIGSTCKAMLRLKVETFEKGLDQEKDAKELRHRREGSSKMKLSPSEKKHSKAFYELSRTLTPDIALIDVSDSEGESTQSPSDVSENSDDISENTGYSWDTVSSISTFGTKATTFTVTSSNTGITGSIGGASAGDISCTESTVHQDENENDTFSSLNHDQNNDSDNEDNLSNVDDEEESVDDTHVTLNFGGTKLKVFTPNPIHVACQGTENTTWLAEKSSAGMCNQKGICNQKVWNWTENVERKKGLRSARSPHGVHELDDNFVDTIPKALTFGERQESLKQTVIDAISCQGSRAARQRYHTRPIEVAVLSAKTSNGISPLKNSKDPIEIALSSARSIVSLDHEDEQKCCKDRTLNLARNRSIERLAESRCKRKELSAKSSTIGTN